MKSYNFPIIKEDKDLPFIVISTGYCNENDLVFSETGYSYYRLFICTSGQGILNFDGYNFTITKNTAFLIPPDRKFTISQATNSINLFWVNFKGSSADYLVFEYFNDEPPVAKLNDMEAIMKIYDSIASGDIDVADYFRMNNSISLYMLILEIQKQHRFCKYRNRNTKLNQLMPVINYMHVNIEKNISLDQLSEIVNFTPQYICRLFKECLDMRPFEYLTKVRIAKAKKLLMETDLQINQIGEMVGFPDSSYFCSAFKKSENCSPAEFREKN